jgi:hypothetical protein
MLALASVVGLVLYLVFFYQAAQSIYERLAQEYFQGDPHRAF